MTELQKERVKPSILPLTPSLVMTATKQVIETTYLPTVTHKSAKLTNATKTTVKAHAHLALKTVMAASTEQPTIFTCLLASFALVAPLLSVTGMDRPVRKTFASTTVSTASTVTVFHQPLTTNATVMMDGPHQILAANSVQLTSMNALKELINVT